MLSKDSEDTTVHTVPYVKWPLEWSKLSHNPLKRWFCWQSLSGFIVMMPECLPFYQVPWIFVNRDSIPVTKPDKWLQSILPFKSQLGHQPSCLRFSLPSSTFWNNLDYTMTTSFQMLPMSFIYHLTNWHHIIFILIASPNYRKKHKNNTGMLADSKNLHIDCGHSKIYAAESAWCTYYFLDVK